MKKYLLIILIALTHNCYAQKVKYYDASKYPMDSIKKIIISPDSVWVVTVNGIISPDSVWVVTVNGTTLIIDSAKIYWKKKVLYEALFNQEIARLNRLKKPQLSQRLLNYQDSLIKYKLLLEKLKK